MNNIFIQRLPGSSGLCVEGFLIWKFGESTNFLAETLRFVIEIICQLYTHGQQFVGWIRVT